MRISDWSSDVFSSDLLATPSGFDSLNPFIPKGDSAPGLGLVYETLMTQPPDDDLSEYGLLAESVEVPDDLSWIVFNLRPRSEEHTSELQSLMRISYAVFCLKKKKKHKDYHKTQPHITHIIYKEMYEPT